MNEHTNATYIASLTAGVVGGFYLALNELIFFRDGFSFLFPGMLDIFLYGLLGLLCASILLFPLKPIFNKYPLSFSCISFLAAGIVVPLLLQHGLNQIHAHGIDPYSPDEKWGTISRMAIICSIGAASSFSAWFTLKRELRASSN
ncbi:hypothetical protein QT397_09220 [Microbulbifer sp. MKSA007]|nr:hypothetical protein QT397_09220 [Microbulbifer sp. MKSA007]